MSTEQPAILSQENMKEIIISRATEEDAKAIPQIQKDGWLSTYVNEELGITEADILSKNFDSEDRVNRWKEAINKPDTATFVAKEGDAPVGFCFVKKGEEHNHLGTLYVLSTARGKGIGTKLTEQALAYLGKEKPIHLEVVSYNDNAISFYEGFGFKRMEQIENPTSGKLPSGVQIPEMKMILNPKLDTV
jgi:ribosomal protein S18 acetylase RimI-like enzyme